MDDVKMQGVIVEVDDQTGKAISIERYSLNAPDGTNASLSDDKEP